MGAADTAVAHIVDFAVLPCEDVHIEAAFEAALEAAFETGWTQP